MTEPPPSPSQAATFMDSTPAADIAAMNDTARGLIMTLRMAGTETGLALCERIADMLTPEMMFNKGTTPFPSLWAELRKFLVTCNVTLKTHQRHRTIYTFANTIHVSENENEMAIELAKRILNGTIYREGTVTQQQENTNKVVNNEEKTAHNIAMRLKDVEQKFSGDLAQCWEDYKDEYEQILEDYCLNDDQRLRSLHNLLCKDAHRFYPDNVKPVAQNYEGARAKN